jgi:hypothetical protein
VDTKEKHETESKQIVQHDIYATGSIEKKCVKMLLTVDTNSRNV